VRLWRTAAAESTLSSLVCPRSTLVSIIDLVIVGRAGEGVNMGIRLQSIYFANLFPPQNEARVCGGRIEVAARSMRRHSWTRRSRMRRHRRDPPIGSCQRSIGTALTRMWQAAGAVVDHLHQARRCSAVSGPGPIVDIQHWIWRGWASSGSALPSTRARARSSRSHGQPLSSAPRNPSRDAWCRERKDEGFAGPGRPRIGRVVLVQHNAAARVWIQAAVETGGVR